MDTEHPQLLEDLRAAIGMVVSTPDEMLTVLKVVARMARKHGLGLNEVQALIHREYSR